MMKPRIICELGGTHDGRFADMVALVDAAAYAGADIVKSQWVSDAQALCYRRHAPSYLADYLKIAYPLEWHAALRQRAAFHGMQYACSIYLPGDAARVAADVDFLKVSSFEAMDRSLIEEARYAMPPWHVIVSLGMDAKSLPIPNDIFWLHCTSCYPAPLDSLRLNRAIFRHGLSDHSRDVRVGAWATLLGAEIIEAHLRLDACDTANKDYAVAFTPDEFREYVRNVRDVAIACGTDRQNAEACDAEDAMRPYRVR